MASSVASPVSVCFIGKNQSGTWAIRGEQMASARSDWKATLDPSNVDLRAFDVYCIVKHPVQSIINDLKRAGKTVVYDVLDAWAQPDDGLKYTTLPEVQEFFRGKWRGLGIDYFIFASRAMQEHLGGLVRYSTFIYHHHWPNRGITPVRQTADVVGYEGNVNYLGPWSRVVERVCQEVGLRFVANPGDWADIDIGLAVRGDVHDSFMANNYKSNVKIANLYASGTPAVVGYKEMACHETDTGDIRFFRNEADLQTCLTQLLDYVIRCDIHSRFLQVEPQFRLSTIADIFEHYFLWAHQRVRNNVNA